jgi:hypothetical protein
MSLITSGAGLVGGSFEGETMTRLPVRHGRALIGLATAAAVATATATLGAAPASSAPSDGDCAALYPQSELVEGQPVTGLTVSKGTTPERFTGEYIGVLNSGIAPGLDMIMVRLSSREIDRVGGIWSGMSGSPVYARDGRLIGAVSYGLAYGASPVAGVTPYDAMDDYLTQPAAARISVAPRTAERIAAETDVSAAEAAQGFARLPMPLSVSGVSGPRLAQAAGKRTWLDRGVRAVGSAAASGTGPGADTIVAGGNLAAALSWGDVTMGGVGTATSVCGDEVVGFGHPMQYLGRTTESLHPASAVYVQEDPIGVPFKVANFGAPVGTITQDRLAGITGTIGTVPESTEVSSTLTYGDRSRTGTSNVSVRSATADVTFYQLLANHDRVIDGYQGGTEVQKWTVQGRDTEGTPFSLDMRDRYVSTSDIAFESPWDVADQAWLLSSLRGVTLDRIAVTTTLDDATTTVRVLRVEQYRAGRWVRVSRRNPILAWSGRRVLLRAIIGNADLNRIVRARFDVPAKARGTRGSLRVAGGAAVGQYVDGTDLGDVLDQYRSWVSNDEIQVGATLRRRGYTFRTSFTKAPRPWVVRGQQTVPMFVR